MNVGERIKSLRKDRGLTQKELSKLSSISEISIRKYENGDRQPKQKAIYHLAKALDVSEGWLMGYDVPMEREENTFLADQTEELSCFIKYLESLKYLIRFEKDVQEWHLETVDNGEEIKVSDTETFTVSLSKDDMTTTFSEEEFEDFCNTIKKSIAFEIFKKSEKA